MVLCAVSLTGCTQAGMCGQDITPAPRITVDVTSWVKAHPDTDVRVCADGSCMTGDHVVVFTVDGAAIPTGDGRRIAITAESVAASIHVESFSTTVQLVRDSCGQAGVWLRMDGTGRLSTAPPV